MKSHLIKVYHDFAKGKKAFRDFLNDMSQTMEGQSSVWGLHQEKGEIFYSLSAGDDTYANIESLFYTHFNDFQIVPDDKGVRNYDPKRTVIGELTLEHSRFFPFKLDDDDDTNLAQSLFRAFENVDVQTDKVGFFVATKPVQNQSFSYYFLFGWLYYLWVSTS